MILRRVYFHWQFPWYDNILYELLMVEWLSYGCVSEWLAFLHRTQVLFLSLLENHTPVWFKACEWRQNCSEAIDSLSNKMTQVILTNGFSVMDLFITCNYGSLSIDAVYTVCVKQIQLYLIRGLQQGLFSHSSRRACSETSIQPLLYYILKSDWILIRLTSWK